MVTAADSAFVYTDPHGLAGLRREARQNSPGAIREAAKQFEAVFVQMMLKSMRAATSSDGGGIMDSDQSLLYRDMYDQQIALSMAQQGKLGPVSYTHLDVYKRQGLNAANADLGVISNNIANNLSLIHI